MLNLSFYDDHGELSRSLRCTRGYAHNAFFPWRIKMSSINPVWTALLFNLLNLAIQLLGVLWANIRLRKGKWTFKVTISRT